MIGSMRRRKGGVGVWIILGLLFVGLIGFGVGGTGGIATTSIGVVGNTQIPIPSYVGTLNQARQQIAGQIGRIPSGAELQAEGILDAVLEDAVRSSALDDMMAELGISVGDETVRDSILNDPSFVGLDGAFNNTGYQFFLNQNGLSARQYEDIIRRGSSRIIAEEIVQLGLRSPDTAPEAIVNYALESRDVAWITLTEADLETPVAPVTDAEIRTFYDDNPNRFVQPETKNLTYVWLTPDLVTSIDIPTDELMQIYEEQKNNRYVLPERRGVERLIFNNIADAQTAKDRLDNGDVTFDALVSERGLSINDIDLGIIEQDSLPENAASDIFGAGEPGVFGPFEDPLGGALYNVSAVLNAQTIPFEEAEAELREELEGNERSNVINNLVSEIDDLLAAGATLEEVANETPMVLETLNYSTESEGGIAAYIEFRDIAAVAQMSDFPELYTLSDGGIFALRVDETLPSGTKPFEEVAEEAADFAQDAKRQSALMDQAEALRLRVEGGESLYALGFRSSAVSDVRRGVPTSDFDFLAITEIFEADLDGFVVLEDDGTVSLLQIEAINAPDLTTSENVDVVQRVGAELSRNMASDMLLSFADAVADDAGVQLDFNVITQVNSQILGLSYGN